MKPIKDNVYTELDKFIKISEFWPEDEGKS
jgi:hypothetical protein